MLNRSEPIVALAERTSHAAVRNSEPGSNRGPLCPSVEIADLSDLIFSDHDPIIADNVETGRPLHGNFDAQRSLYVGLKRREKLAQEHLLPQGLKPGNFLQA